MKNRRYVYVTLLLVLLLTLSGCYAIKSESKKPGSEYGGKPMLSLVLTLDKTLYTLNEAIEADVLLKNTGTGYITVNARMAPVFLPVLGNGNVFEGEILFVIESPSGNRATTNGNWRIGMIVESDFKVLSPRMGIQCSYNLQEDYNLDEFGAYSVYVIYQNQLDPQKGSAAWKGELTSNTVYFEVTP